MKHNMFKTFALVTAVTLVLGACSKTAAPVVTFTEVGHENSHTVVAGDELHLEADIEAEGIVREISLHIEDVSHHSFIMDTLIADGNYVGVRNTEFHEHIDIPATSAPGRYSVELAVSDREGQTSSASDSFTVVAQ